MTTSARLAIALAVLFFLGAAAATFLPASASPGGDCGTWVSPAYDRSEVADLLERTEEVSRGLDALGGDGGEARAAGAAYASWVVQCDDTLGTRRTIAMVLAGLMLVAPGAVLFVAGRDPQPSA